MHRAFHTFIGVDLGGGKGKTTAVARLRLRGGAAHGGHADQFTPTVMPTVTPTATLTATANAEVIVEDFGGARPWYDGRLIEYLLQHAEEAVVAVDAPLTLTACVRCPLPACPGLPACQVPTVRWFHARAERAAAHAQGKPRYTPYTQRATEVVLHENYGIMPRETLGQGMGPLTARMAYLRHALSARYTLNHNLLEVYPKATLAQLFPDAEPASPARPQPGIDYKDGNGQPVSLYGAPRSPQRVSQVARHYKRSGHARQIRERVIMALTDLGFGPGQWREFALQSDHQFDALICAYTAFLWARDGWQLPDEPVFREDGWIWFPPRTGRESK